MPRLLNRHFLAVAVAVLAPALLVTMALAQSPTPSPSATPSPTPTVTPTLPPPPSYAGPAVATATAELKNASGQVVGSAHFSQNASGVVLIKATFSGVAGAHGMHIHAVAKCDAPDFTSAGAHFNPTGKKHGLLNPEGPHAGDLPEITVTSEGSGSLETTTDRISLTGGISSLFDSDGSVLVIHAGHDDQVTDPTGNSGARLACGVIVAPSALPTTGGSSGDDGNPWLPLSALAGAAALAAAAGFVTLKRMS